MSPKARAWLGSRFFVLLLAAVLTALSCPLAEAQTVTATVTAGMGTHAVAA